MFDDDKRLNKRIIQLIVVNSLFSIDLWFALEALFMFIQIFQIWVTLPKGKLYPNLQCNSYSERWAYCARMLFGYVVLHKYGILIKAQNLHIMILVNTQFCLLCFNMIRCLQKVHPHAVYLITWVFFLHFSLFRLSMSSFMKFSYWHTKHL